MADFAVAGQGQNAGAGLADLGRSVEQAQQQKLQLALLLQDRKRADDRFVQQLLMGVSTSEASQYAPDLVQDMQQNPPTTPEEAATRIGRIGNVSTARKSQIDELARLRHGISATMGAGQDPNEQIAANQAIATSGKLTPEQVAQNQQQLGVAAEQGRAQRGSVLEGRAYDEGEFNRKTDMQRQESDRVFARNEQAQIAAEGRATAADTEKTRQSLALNLGLPIDAPMQAIEAARFERQFGGAVDPKEQARTYEANVKVYDRWQKVRGKDKDNDARISTDVASLEREARSLMELAKGSGATMVPVIRPTGKDGWFSDPEMSLELRDRGSARVIIGATHDAAQQGSKQAQTAFRMYEEQAKTNPFLRRVLEEQLEPEAAAEAQKRAIEPIELPKNVKRKPEPGESGRAVGKAVREVFSPSDEDKAQTAANREKSKAAVRKHEKEATKRRRAVGENISGFVEGLSGK